MERIDGARELAHLLREAQQQRMRHVACLLEPGFAGRHTDQQLRDLADMMLPVTQARRIQLHRQRDGVVRFGVTMTLREGVRLADAVVQGREESLAPKERQTLALAREILRDMCGTTETAHYRSLFELLAARVVYENLSPGHSGYPELTCASGALANGRANCQGFADAYRLLCALAGLKANYLCCWAGKGIHLLNSVEVNGQRYAADVSRASRMLRRGASVDAVFMMDNAGCSAQGLRWPEWMEEL